MTDKLAARTDAETGKVLPLSKILTAHIDQNYGGVQMNLARKIGANSQYIGRIVSGRARLPDEPWRSRIAEELGIPLRYMFVISGDLTPQDVGYADEEEEYLSQGSRRIAQILDGFDVADRTLVTEMVDALLEKNEMRRRAAAAEGVERTTIE